MPPLATRATHNPAGALQHDGMVVAATLLAGCKRLCTEDLQDGQRLEGLTIRNPFAPPHPS